MCFYMINESTYQFATYMFNVREGKGSFTPPPPLTLVLKLPPLTDKHNYSIDLCFIKHTVCSEIASHTTFHKRIFPREAYANYPSYNISTLPLIYLPLTYTVFCPCFFYQRTNPIMKHENYCIRDIHGGMAREYVTHTLGLSIHALTKTSLW